MAASATRARAGEQPEKHALTRLQRRRSLRWRTLACLSGPPSGSRSHRSREAKRRWHWRRPPQLSCRRRAARGRKQKREGIKNGRGKDGRPKRL
jgi:hypothetical protein